MFTNRVAVLGGGPEWYIQTRPGTTNSRSYSMYWKSDLLNGADWAPAGEGTLGDLLGAALEFIVTNHDACGFYRTVIRPP